MRSYFLSATAAPVFFALITLTGCPNDPIGGSVDLETAEAAYFDKLQACGILSEGRTPSIVGYMEPGMEEPYICAMDCIRSKPCGDLRAAMCYDDDQIYEECWMRCMPSGFRCGNGEEVPVEYQCDGENDCSDGSDEQNCTDPTGFICGDGYEIPTYYVCDDDEDCSDGSDEINCPTPPTFACNNGELINPASVCDEYDDCSDGSDETDCAQLMCF